MLDEPCVRLRGRPEHGDPFERCAVAGGVEDVTDGDADLVVGVGGGDDRHRPGVGERRGWTGRVHAERCEDRPGIGVGEFVAGELHDDADVDALTQCTDEGERQTGQLLGEVDDEVGEPIGHGAANGVGGVGVQVGLVVPAVGQSRRDGLAEPDRLSSPQRLRRQSATCGGVGGAQLVVEFAYRDDRRGVRCHGTESAGFGLERCGDGEIDDGCRRRRPPGSGEPGPGDEFGQPVEGDHVDRDEPSRAAQGPPAHHAARVRRHRHGDGGERVGALRRGDGGSERSQRLPGRDDSGRDGHVTDCRERV